jgi:hypothetical protein
MEFGAVTHFRNDAYDGARSSSFHTTYSGGGTLRITEVDRGNKGGNGKIKDSVTIHVFLRQKGLHGQREK